jgi:hypothetical protein
MITSDATSNRPEEEEATYRGRTGGLPLECLAWLASTRRQKESLVVTGLKVSSDSLIELIAISTTVIQ